MRTRLTALILLATLAPAACAGRIAPYDQAVERDLVVLYANLSGFFDQLQTAAGTPAAEWERHQAFYDRTRAEIAAVRARAALLPGNDQTVRAVDLLAQTLGEIEEMHAEGITAPEIPILRQMIGAQLRALIRLETAKKAPSPAGEVSP
jgi:hypothetical protein